jgi:hypothetical protein
LSTTTQSHWATSSTPMSSSSTHTSTVTTTPCAGVVYDGQCCTGCWDGTTCQLSNSVSSCWSTPGQLCEVCADPGIDCRVAECTPDGCAGVDYPSAPDGTSCDGGTCKFGECRAPTCGTGLVRVGDSCVPCGAVSQPCCSMNVCNSGSSCSSGTCVFSP